MIRFFALLLFCTLLPSLGLSDNTFFQQEKRAYISPENFKNYVRPQVKSIIQEYYAMAARLGPLQADLLEVKNKIFDLKWKWMTWYQECQKISYPCTARLHDFYATSRNIDIMVLQLQKNAFILNNTLDNLHINTVILLSHSLDRISNLNYTFLHHLEEILITANTQYFKPFSSSDYLTPILHEMHLTSEETINGGLEKNVRENFDYIWANFIKKLEEYVVLKEQSNYIPDRLDELNLAWNSFHTKISSRDYKLPGHILASAATIRDRWNSIIKLITIK
jgi:hypothetical protein